MSHDKRQSDQKILIYSVRKSDYHIYLGISTSKFESSEAKLFVCVSVTLT